MSGRLSVLSQLLIVLKWGETWLISKPGEATSLKKGLIGFMEIAQAPLGREALFGALRCRRPPSGQGASSVVGLREAPTLDKIIGGIK